MTNPNELESAQYRGLFVDETGTAVVMSVLTTLTLTLYNLATSAIINSRNAQNVKNANNVTIYDTPQTASDGSKYNLLWAMVPADNPVVNQALQAEPHIALFQGTWSAGAKRLNHAVAITVQRVLLVTP